MHLTKGQDVKMCGVRNDKLALFILNLMDPIRHLRHHLTIHFFRLQWGSANPELSKVQSFKAGVGQDIALHVPPSAAVPELPNDRPHQSPKQSHAEDHSEQIEATSGEDHC